MKSSTKILKLLQYLIINRHKLVTREELLEHFCDDDQTGDPGSALRMLVFRLRNVLHKNGLYIAKDLILSKNGSYMLNNAINLDVDVEEFESFSKKADKAIGDDERLYFLLRAVELYRGDFLPNSSDQMWVMSLQSWYRSQYMKCALKALEILTSAGQLTEAEKLCVDALQIEPFNEDLHTYYLRALIEQGKNQEALDAYIRVETMFYDVLGVDLTENLRNLYSQIDQPKVNKRLPLDSILSEYLEGSDFPGGYYCDPSVFKSLYQIESRSVARSGRSTYIVMIDVKHELRSKRDGVMKHLGMVIPNKLRKGDLYTRASPSQYILMLHNLTYENCKTLIIRIMNALDAKHLSRIVGTSIKAVKPLT